MELEKWQKKQIKRVFRGRVFGRSIRGKLEAQKEHLDKISKKYKEALKEVQGETALGLSAKLIVIDESASITKPKLKGIKELMFKYEKQGGIQYGYRNN